MTTLASFFRTIIIRHFTREWGKLLLSVAGVTIGVAAFVAIRLANTTAFDAFSASLDAVAGRANLQVVASGGQGIDERLLELLRESPAVAAAAPAIEQYAQVVDSAELSVAGSGAPVLVFGIDPLVETAFRSYQFADERAQPGAAAGLDFLRRSDAIVVTTTLARRLRVNPGDSLRLIAHGRRLAFVITGLVEPQGAAAALGGSFALLDIATAQETFDRVGRVDRIDLIVPDDDVDGVAHYLRDRLPAGVVLQRPSSRNEQARRMLESFDLNLTALAFIALFVSMFIIYNTLLTSTLRRRRELGILRALGAARGLVVALLLGEAFAIGVLGAAVGLPVGIALARGALDQVVQTVTALYVLAAARDLVLDPITLAIGAAMGAGASVVAALPAAIEASRVHPRETFSVQFLEKRVATGIRWMLLASALMLVGALLASLQGLATMNPLPGFAGAALVLLGFALLTPSLLLAGNRLFGSLVRSVLGIEGELAIAYLIQSLGRASTAIAALMIAIAMLIGVSTMIGSFRSTVELWMHQTISADLYVTISSNRLAPSAIAAIPAEVIRFVDSLPNVSHVDAVRRLRGLYRGRLITVSGARLDLPPGDKSLEFMEGDWDGVLDAMDRDAAAVSESFSRRFEKGRGDTIVLSTPSGDQALRIAGIYYDYTTDAGAVMLRHATFARLFRDTTLTNVALYLPDTAHLDGVRELIERRFGSRYSLLVYSNRALRHQVLDIFDQTFAITYALQVVAIVVAAIGVANTLAALVVERSREIGIMKAIGASARQVRRMTLVQAGLIALASQTLGVVAGLLLSAILIYVINRVSFGWTIQFELFPDVIAGSTLLVIATALVSGLVPAMRAARKDVAEVLRSE